MTTTAEKPKTHPFNMYKHIIAQPDAVHRVLTEEQDQIRAFAKKIVTSK